MSEAALERVRPAAQAIIQKLRALHDAPDEIEVEFGLKRKGASAICKRCWSARPKYAGADTYLWSAYHERLLRVLDRILNEQVLEHFIGRMRQEIGHPEWRGGAS